VASGARKNRRQTIDFPDCRSPPNSAVGEARQSEHEVGEPVKKLHRRELDHAIGPRPRGLAPTTPPDPVGRLMSRQHVADASDLAVCTAAHGEPLEREGWPGAIPQPRSVRRLQMPASPLWTCARPCLMRRRMASAGASFTGEKRIAIPSIRATTARNLLSAGGP